MEYKYFNYRGDEWAVSFYPGLLGVQKNGVKKWVRVVEDPSETYYLMKTKIKADGGAEKLYRWIVRCFENQFCECLAYKVLTWAFDEMREAA